VLGSRNEQKNLDRVRELETLLYEAFSPYVEQALQAAFGGDWQARALNALPEFYRRDGEDWRQDLRALFIIVLNNQFWKEVFEPSLHRDDRTRIRELRSIANKRAHTTANKRAHTQTDSTDSISTIVVYRTLDNVRELLTRIGAENGVDPRVEIELLRELLAEAELKVAGLSPPVLAEASSPRAGASASAAISGASADPRSLRRRARRPGEDEAAIPNDPAREGSSTRTEHPVLVLARKLLQLDEAGRHRDSRVRSRAVEQLAELGPSLVRAHPSLAAELRAKDKKTRLEAAARSLFWLKGTAVRVLIEALEDSDLKVRLTAIEALRKMEILSSQAAPALTGLLDHPDPRLNSAAAMALTEVSATARPLVAILSSGRRADPLWKDNEVRHYAVAALNRLLEHNRALQWTEESHAAVALLAEAATDEDADLRLSAVKALGKIRGVLPAILPALCAALGDSDKDVRWAAAAALGDHGDGAHPAVPALCPALADSYLQVRVAAAGSLGKIGPKAMDAIPALTAALDDSGVHEAARYALSKIRSSTPSGSVKPSGPVMRPIELGERQSFAHGSSKAVVVPRPPRTPP
jgi:HEAT repeat protein